MRLISRDAQQVLTFAPAFTWTLNPSEDAAADQPAQTVLSRLPDRAAVPIAALKYRKSLQQPKAIISAGGNMIAASSKGDMLEGPTHLATNQLKPKSMDTTNRTRPSNGKTSPVNIETQLGAAFDQSMPSNWSWRVASEMSAKSELSPDPMSREPNGLETASFILIAMILNKVIIFKTSDRKPWPTSAGRVMRCYSSDLIPFIG
jgi:hypothetical protein